MNDKKILQALNDKFRKSILDPAGPTGGIVVVTPGIDSLDPEVQRGILHRIAKFTNFTRDNDPYHEHDFGNFTYMNHHIYFKIDYYDTDFLYGSETPSDQSHTRRVLTIMLSDEY